MSWAAFWDNFTGTLVAFALFVMVGSLFAASVARKTLRSRDDAMPTTEQRITRRFAVIIISTLGLGWLLVALFLGGV